MSCKIFLLTFMLILLLQYILKMYNSDENYQQDEQNGHTQSQAVSATQQRNMRLNNSRPKNAANFIQKNNSILGTYTRIIPKKPLYDYERIYADNIQLRQKIKSLEEDNLKFKTRVSIIERQKQQLIVQLANNDYGGNNLKDRRPSLKGIARGNQKSSKMANDQNRRILHGHKQQISKLKVENGRLKKTVKYTQIQQLQTQNKLLQQQVIRMRKYVQDVLGNLSYDEYQKQIELLNKQIQGQKGVVKSMQSNMKRKDQQIQQLRNKLKIMASKKSQMEKKLNRDISNARGQINRFKQKQKDQVHNNLQLSKPKRVESFNQCKNCNSKSQVVEKLKTKNNQLQKQLKQKTKQINDIKIKIKQMDKTRHQSQLSPSNKNSSKVQSNTVIKQKKKTSGPSQNRDQHQEVKNKKKTQKRQQQPHKNNKKQKQTKKRSQQDDHQQYQYDYQKQIYKQSEIGQQEDKVDVFHVNMQKQKNDSKVQNESDLKDNKAKENNKNTDQQYEDQFNQENEEENYEQYDKQMLGGQQSQEQVLFKKQEHPNKNIQKSSPVKQQKVQKPKKDEKHKKDEKPKQKQKQKQKQKDKDKDKDKEKVSTTKAEKILKQTIKYRLIAQRYNFADFKRDISESNATQFTVQQLIQMLSGEPFFLTQQHLEMVMFQIFKKQQLQANDSVEVKPFLKVMKGLIGQFEIVDQNEQQKIAKAIQKKIKPQKLIGIMQQQSIDGKFISKKAFVKILKQSAGLADHQVQHCLAEVSVLSVDIAHINYEQFLQRMSTNHK